MGWVAKQWKTCVDLRANLISTKVSANHRKSTQVHGSPGQTKSQVDPSLQLASTCVSVWSGLKSAVFGLKPWPNGVASRRKLKTCVYLRFRLARASVHLRWLAMTCAHFGRDQICTQIKASFSPFGHPTQVNTSWVTSINLLLANKIEDSLP